MKNRKGSTLVMTLMIFAVLMIFGTVVLNIMVTENKQSLNHQYKTQAYYIARSGAVSVEAAIMDMQDDKGKLDELLNELPLKIDISEFNFINGELKEVNLKKENNSFVIESIGTVKEISQVVSLYIPYEKIQSMNSIDMAIFSLGSITFESGTQSNLTGPIGTNAEGGGKIKYGNQNFGNGVIVNIPIEYKDDDSTVFDSTNGAAYKPIVDFINKRNYSMPTFPNYPSNLVNKGSITTSGDITNPVISSDGYYEELTIESNRSITLNASENDITLRIKNFDVQQGSIIVEGSGKVKIFIENYIKLKGSLNKNGDIKNVEVYYNGTPKIDIENETKIYGSLYVEKADVNIMNSGSIDGNLVSGGSNIKVSGGSYVHKGVIYAPNANIKFGGSGSVNGGVVGKTITLSGGASIKYDSNYANNIPIEDAQTDGITLKNPSYFKDE